MFKKLLFISALFCSLSLYASFDEDLDPSSGSTQPMEIEYEVEEQKPYGIFTDLIALDPGCELLIGHAEKKHPNVMGENMRDYFTEFLIDYHNQTKPNPAIHSFIPYMMHASTKHILFAEQSLIPFLNHYQIKTSTENCSRIFDEIRQHDINDIMNQFEVIQNVFSIYQKEFLPLHYLSRNVHLLFKMKSDDIKKRVDQAMWRLQRYPHMGVQAFSSMLMLSEDEVRRRSNVAYTLFLQQGLVQDDSLRSKLFGGLIQIPEREIFERFKALLSSMEDIISQNPSDFAEIPFADYLLILLKLPASEIITKAGILRTVIAGNSFKETFRIAQYSSQRIQLITALSELPHDQILPRIMHFTLYQNNYLVGRHQNLFGGLMDWVKMDQKGLDTIVDCLNHI